MTDLTTSIALSPDAQILLAGQRDSIISVIDQRKGAVETLRGHAGIIRSVAISADGKTALSGGANGSAEVWDLQSGKELNTFAEVGHDGLPPVPTRFVALSGDGSKALTIGAKVWFRDLKNRASDKIIDSAGNGWGKGVSSIAFSNSGQSALIGLNWSSNPYLVDITEDRSVNLNSSSFQTSPNKHLTFGFVDAVALTVDSRFAFAAYRDNAIRMWSLPDGREVARFEGHLDQVTSLAIAHGGESLVSSSRDGTVAFWPLSNHHFVAGKSEEVTNSRRLGISISGERWLVTADARFEVSDFNAKSDLYWIATDDPFHALPLEIFMRDYYEPRLMPRLLAGEKLADLPPLSDLNRVQPLVEVADVRSGAQPDEAVVTVIVSGNHGEFQRTGGKVTMETDVHDLRLFRDGQLVGQWPEPEPGTVLKNGVTLTPMELGDWRKATCIRLTNGTASESFTVRLPHLQAGKKVVFSAYAFNVDRVKSATATREYTVPANLAPLRPRAYVISVGVNAYENPGWNLRFAASDARRMKEALEASGLKKEYEVVPILLTSEVRVGGSRDHATKAAFQAVLERLAGKRHELPPVLNRVANMDRLTEARPDDLVILTVSSHGYTDYPSGMFYIIPSDSGQTQGEQITPTLLKKWISSDELSEWLRGVDAGDLVMIVDTCHSAATVDVPGFKPGPMGSRGLGQLAYDKGMRILAASQANDVALESEKIKQGLLTYALVQNGLIDHKAGARDSNGEITLDQWLQYGVDRVPNIYEQILRTGTVKALGIGSRDTPVNLALSSHENSLKKNAFQQPTLFNFDKSHTRQILLAAHK